MSDGNLKSGAGPVAQRNVHERFHKLHRTLIRRRTTIPSVKCGEITPPGQNGEFRSFLARCRIAPGNLFRQQWREAFAELLTRLVDTHFDRFGGAI